jgi:transposase
MTNQFWGVDVAKDTLEIATTKELITLTLENNKSAIRQWLKTLPENSYIGMESTGSYHRLLAELAHAKGITIYLLQPRNIHHYAKGIGVRAKTDPCDARVIARYIENEHAQLRPWIPHNKYQLQLEQLLKRRATVVRARGIINQSFKEMDILGKDSKKLCEHVDDLIHKIELAIDKLMDQNPEVSEKRKRLKTIPGIGDVVSAGLAMLFHRIPFTKADSAIAFIGLDPQPRESGKWIGKRRLSKRGPAEMRRLLYNAAMAGAKTETWKHYYLHQRAKGLSSTASLVILSRKILKVAFAMWNKAEAVFQQELVIMPCQKP